MTYSSIVGAATSLGLRGPPSSPTAILRCSVARYGILRFHRVDSVFAVDATTGIRLPVLRYQVRPTGSLSLLAPPFFLACLSLSLSLSLSLYLSLFVFLCRVRRSSIRHSSKVARRSTSSVRFAVRAPKERSSETRQSDASEFPQRGDRRFCLDCPDRNSTRWNRWARGSRRGDRFEPIGRRSFSARTTPPRAMSHVSAFRSFRSYRVTSRGHSFAAVSFA